MEKKIEHYKDLLFKAEFKEANENPLHFFKKVSEKTAFILNLSTRNNVISIIYGYCSIPADETTWFSNYGKTSDEINLRYYSEITSDEDEKFVNRNIQNIYNEYKATNKDELLKIVKTKRKNFINLFSEKLKPLGFKKCSNQWRKEIAPDTLLVFRVDKNSYSDLYCFQIQIHKISEEELICCYDEELETSDFNKFDWELYAKKNVLFDWQLETPESTNKFIDLIINRYLLPYSNTPLEILGKQETIKNYRWCTKNICENCWIKSN